jgi:hypothetical protein
LAIAAPKLDVVVVLPTPPLPEVTTIIRLILLVYDLCSCIYFAVIVLDFDQSMPGLATKKYSVW